jgi:hypothetical protein
MTAQPTPSVPRAYVAPGPDGIAHGTSADEDIFATGSGQILNGGGGNDIFHLGTFTDAAVIVPAGGGITEIATYAGSYTLPAGVDNLSGNGDGAHTLTGNALDNTIAGAGGNDTIDGGPGDDSLAGGGGHNTFIETAGNGSDQVFFTVGAGGDVMDLSNYGYTSFADVISHMKEVPGVPGPILQHPNGEHTLFLPTGSESSGDIVPANFTADNFVLSGSPPSEAGEHQHTLTVRLAEDDFNGPAQFTLDVDGVQIAGPTAVAVKHGDGFQDFTYTQLLPDAPHSIAVHFINDAYGGSPGMDRNLYVSTVFFDDFNMSGSSAQNDATNGQPPSESGVADMYVNGTATFSDITRGSPGHSPPGTVPITLHLSEDAWNGDAQFTVDVDGTNILGTKSVAVAHDSGGSQDFTFFDLIGSGTHTVSVHFINDAWGGTPDTDRNLYVNSLDVNGVHFAGNTAANDAANGHASDDPTAAVMDINGTATFTFDQSQINHSAPPEIMG